MPAAARPPRRPRPALAVLAALAAAVAAACAANPVTGRPELMVYDDAAEARMGAKADADLVAHHGEVESKELRRYVEEVGKKVAGVNDRQGVEWRFRILDDSIVNAFALPGGFVYLTRGLLAHLQDEAGLVGVLGHEVGHVAARHGAKSASRDAVFGLPRRIVGAIVPGVAEGFGLIRAALSPITLTFSRDDERQADDLGVKYSTRLGYDARSLAAFMGTLDRLTPAGERLPTWASTHPDPGDRKATILERTATAQKDQPGPWATNPDALLDHLDGLVHGDDPRVGVLEAERVLLPSRRLSIPRPKGWQAEVTRTRVTMVDEGGERAVVVRRFGTESPRQAADTFLRQRELTLEGREDLTLPIGAAHQVVAATEHEDWRTISTFFRLGDDVWAVHAVARGRDFAAARAVLEGPAKGLAPLPEAEARAFKPVVLRVVQAAATGTFREAVAAYPIPAQAKVDLAGLALLNGLTPDAPVAGGQRLKVLALGE